MVFLGLLETLNLSLARKIEVVLSTCKASCIQGNHSMQLLATRQDVLYYSMSLTPLLLVGALWAGLVFCL